MMTKRIKLMASIWTYIFIRQKYKNKLINNSHSELSESR